MDGSLMNKESNRIIKFWKGSSGRYYWTLFSGNGDALCEGIKGYTTSTNAKRAARELFPTAQVDKEITIT
jgi:uncharacterized protein YegP (UPF0339 family)